MSNAWRRPQTAKTDVALFEFRSQRFWRSKHFRRSLHAEGEERRRFELQAISIRWSRPFDEAHQRKRRRDFLKHLDKKGQIKIGWERVQVKKTCAKSKRAQTTFKTIVLDFVCALGRSSKKWKHLHHQPNNSSRTLQITTAAKPHQKWQCSLWLSEVRRATLFYQRRFWGCYGGGRDRRVASFQKQQAHSTKPLSS